MKSLAHVKTDLPPGTEVNDFVRPKRVYTKKTYKLKNPKDVEDTALGDYGKLVLLLTPGFGWVIATLPISRTRNAAYVDRTYGVRVSDGGTVRVGSGPHVTQKLELYLRPSRMKVLQPLLDLWLKGMGRANEIRDRISTRRALGVQHRALGHYSWRWNDPV